MKSILSVLAELLRAWAMVLAMTFAALALAAQGGRFSDRLDVLTHFTPIWLFGLVLSVAIWLATGQRGRITPVLALAGVLSALTLMTPELSAMAAVRPAPETERSERLTVVQFNLWGRNTDPEATARWILATDPDVVVVEEAFGEARGVLRALAGRYPHSTVCACSTLVLSKVQPVASGGLLDSRVSGSWATLPGPGGPFTVVAAHYGWPVPAGDQQQSSLRLSQVLARFPQDRLIVAGDFNSTPWSFSLRRQDRLFGLERRTHGLASWPAAAFSRLKIRFPLAFFPIDHLYAGDAWRTVEVRRGPKLGSDHYPVVVTLAASM